MKSVLLIALAVLGAACGKQIGDACIVDSDCSTDGTRTCSDPNSNSGYCTIQGCDYDTCPGEAECVRFFTGSFDNRVCDYLTEDITTDDCSLDELCDLEGHCVSRSSEIRFCMKKCGSPGDCRGGFECRNYDLMIQHGGEPVLAPGDQVTDSVSAFCAPAPE